MSVGTTIRYILKSLCLTNHLTILESRKLSIHKSYVVRKHELCVSSIVKCSVGGQIANEKPRMSFVHPTYKNYLIVKKPRPASQPIVVLSHEMKCKLGAKCCSPSGYHLIQPSSIFRGRQHSGRNYPGVDNELRKNKKDYDIININFAL